MIKMIVTDLDDTLLRTDKTISAYTIDTFRKAKERRIKIVFATARGGSTKSLVPYELFDGYILMNGAKAYIEDRLIYNKVISPDLFQPFLKALSGHKLKVAAEVSGMHYANFDVRHRWSYLNNYEISDFEGISEGADKLYAVIDDPHQVELMTSILPEELYLHVSRDHLAMVMHKEAKKMSAIRVVAQGFHISIDEIVAFGDDINDKEMLTHCGTSVAMGNAIDEIKNIADHICDTNDQDGVAKWIEQHILSDRMKSDIG